MSNIFNLVAEERTKTGKSEAKKLRNAGKIPAIIYGPNKEPKAVSVDYKIITKRFHQGRFYTQLCEIELAGKKIQVIPKDLYRHPITDNVEHVDFYELDEKSKIKIKLQITLENSDLCAGIKQGGILSHSVRKIEVACLPKDILSEIAIDVKELELGHSIHISDIDLPKEVEILSNIDQALVAVVGRKAAVSEEDEENSKTENGEEEKSEDKNADSSKENKEQA